MTVPVLLSTVVLGIASCVFGGCHLLNRYIAFVLDKISYTLEISKGFFKKQGRGGFLNWMSQFNKVLFLFFSFQNTGSKKTNTKRFQRKKKKPIEMLTQEEKKSKRLFENALKEFEKINYPGNDTLIDHLDKRD